MSEDRKSSNANENKIDSVRILAARIQASCAQLNGTTSKQHSVQVQLYEALVDLEHILETLPRAELRTCQQDVEKSLREASFGDAASSLSGSFHELLGRIWSSIFSNGDTRNLLEVASECQTVSSSKTKSALLRLGALQILQSLFGSQGRILQGHLPATYTLAKGLQKETDPSLRAHGLSVLAYAIFACGPSGASQHRDVTKLVLRTASDKVPAVRGHGLKLASAIVKASDRFKTVGSDAILSMCTKSLSDQGAGVAEVAAEIVAEILYTNVLGNPDESARELSASKHPEDETASTRDANSTRSMEGQASAAEPVRKSSMQGLSGLSATFNMSRKKTSLTTWYSFATAMKYILASYVEASTHSSRVAHACAMASLLHRAARYCGLAAEKDDGDVPGGPAHSLSTKVRGMLNLALSLLDHPDVVNGKASSQPVVKSILGGMAIGMGIGVPPPDAMQGSLLGTASAKPRDKTIATWLRSSEATRTQGCEHRAVVKYVLRRGIGSRLNEAFQLEFLRRLVQVLGESKSPRRGKKRLPSVGRSGSIRNAVGGMILGQGTVAKCWVYSANHIICALHEIGFLLGSLSGGAGKVEHSLSAALLSLLYHPESLVRTEAAAVLRAYCLALPHAMPAIAMDSLQMLGMMHADVSVSASTLEPLEGGKSLADEGARVPALVRTLNALEGHVIGISAIVHASIAHRGSPSWTSAGYVVSLPSFLTISILGNAKALIARQYDRTSGSGVAFQCAHAGWILVSTLVHLGPEFCVGQLDQLFGLWQEAFAVCTLRDTLVSESQDRIPQLRCTLEATESLANFISANHKLIQDVPNVLETITAFLNNIAESVHQVPPAVASPGASEIMSIHRALFVAISSLPRQGIRGFQSSVLSKLTSLALSYFGDGTISDNSIHGNDLGFGPGDAVLSYVSPTCPSNLDVKLSTPSPQTATTSVASGGGLGQGAAGSALGLSNTSPIGSIRCSDGFVFRNFPINLRDNGEAVVHRESFDSMLEVLHGTIPLSDMEAQRSLLACMACLSLHSRPGAGDVKKPNDSIPEVFPREPSEGKTLQVGVPPAGFTCGDVWSPESMMATWHAAGHLATPVPQHPVVSVAVVDASILFFSSQFGAVPDDVRDIQIATFVATLKNASSTKSRAARNTLAALSCAFQGLESAPAPDRSAAAWVGKAKGLLCAALSSPQPTVRKCAANGISSLTSVFGVPFGTSVVQTLSQQLGQVPEGGAAQTSLEETSPYLRTGVAFALGGMKRAVGPHTPSAYLPSGLMYNLCKGVAQPERTWTLHSWKLMVDEAGIDIAKYVSPTLALVSAHLLDDGRYRGGWAARVSLYTCLARLLNSLIAGLGPEFCTFEPMNKFVGIWNALRHCPTEAVQFECLRTLKLVALFHPSYLSSSPTMLRYMWKHLTRDSRSEFDVHYQMEHVSMSYFTQTCAAQCFAQLSKSDSRFATNYILRNHMVRAVELSGRMDTEILCGSRAIVMADAGAGVTFSRSATAAAFHRRSAGGRELEEATWDYCEHAVSLVVEALAEAPSDHAELTVHLHRGMCEWMSFAQKVMVNTTSSDCTKFWIPSTASDGQQEECFSDSDESREGDISRQEKQRTQHPPLPEDPLASLVLDGLASNRSVGVTGKLVQNPLFLISRQNPDAIVPADAMQGEDRALSWYWGALCESRWQTKLLVGRLWLSLMTSVQGSGRLENHLDLKKAREEVAEAGTSWDSGAPLRVERLVLNLIDLVSSACQLVTSSVEGHGVPALQHLGLGCLDTILDAFALYSDPDDPSKSILRQFEAQLSAPVRSVLKVQTSTVSLHPIACQVLTKQLLFGVSSTSTTSRVVASLLPDPRWATNQGEAGTQRDSASDDDSDSDQGTDDNETNLVDRAQAEILVTRLEALGNLYLASHGMVPAQFTTRVLNKQNLKLQSQLMSVIGKTLKPALPKIVPLWFSHIQDVMTILSDPAKDIGAIPIRFTIDTSPRSRDSQKPQLLSIAVRQENSVFDLVEDAPYLAGFLFNSCWTSVKALSVWCKSKASADPGSEPDEVTLKEAESAFAISIGLCTSCPNPLAMQFVSEAVDSIGILWGIQSALNVEHMLLTVRSLNHLLSVCRTRASMYHELRLRVLQVLGHIARTQPSIFSHALSLDVDVPRPLLVEVTYPVHESKKHLNREKGDESQRLKLLQVALVVLGIVVPCIPETQNELFVEICEMLILAGQVVGSCTAGMETSLPAVHRCLREVLMSPPLAQQHEQKITKLGNVTFQVERILFKQFVTLATKWSSNISPLAAKECIVSLLCASTVNNSMNTIHKSLFTGLRSKEKALQLASLSACADVLMKSREAKWNLSKEIVDSICGLAFSEALRIVSAISMDTSESTMDTGLGIQTVQVLQSISTHPMTTSQVFGACYLGLVSLLIRLKGSFAGTNSKSMLNGVEDTILRLAIEVPDQFKTEVSKLDLEVRDALQASMKQAMARAR